jgi:hypothetical protein
MLTNLEVSLGDMYTGRTVEVGFSFFFTASSSSFGRRYTATPTSSRCSSPSFTLSSDAQLSSSSISTIFSSG